MRYGAPNLCYGALHDLMGLLHCLFAALIVCWAPFSILTSFINLDMFLTSYVYFILYELSIYLLYINSFVNPLILYWCSRDYKKAYKDIMRCLHCACCMSR